MDTLSYRTISVKQSEADCKWYIVNADGMVLGRLASEIAKMLKGKNKRNYTPHVLCGDFVIVVNADRIKLTGNKWDNKQYLLYSGYPGGLKKTNARHQHEKKPTSLVEKAVKGMLPKNKLGRDMFRNMYVYVGTDHPHQAQKPTEVKL